MGEPERNNPQTPNNKKNSIDDIIDHMTADLQSYDGQYILLGSPPNQQHIWSEYPASPTHPMTVHNPVFVQHTYDMQERQTPPGMFYPNTNRIREGPGEMIGMMDVGGGNFVNVVFNPNNPGAQIHPLIPTHHPDPNLGFIHYQQQHLQQQQPQPPVPNMPSVQRDYGLFSPTATEATSQNNHQLIDNVVGNWLPNKSGTYSPFGNVVHSPVETKEESIPARPGQPSQSKKQRIVAEVRPMRPSYSDVLAKSIPPLTPPLPSAKSPPLTNANSKSEGRKQSSKAVKGGSNVSKTLNLSSLKRQLSNSSEEQVKGNVKRWISLDDLTPPQSSEENSFNDFEIYLDENVGNSSDNTQPATGEQRKEKKQKKKSRPTEERCEALNNHKTAGVQGNNKRPLHINNNLQAKSASEKNITKSGSKNVRSPQEEPRKVGGGVVNGSSKAEERGPSVSRVSRSGGSSSSSHKRAQRAARKRDGNSYFNLLFRQWQEKTSRYCVMFLTWFLHLIWDVLAMSARLLVHLCEVMAETGLVWLAWLQTRVTRLSWWGWWRRWGWGRTPTPPPPKPSESTLPGGLTVNISLPATGDEAMKRLLACKGKDPYSILGVTNTCSDDDIKKYYKRQAVLVHPDKNSQPGAEEAFKILVHAFELIGEPERRSAYDRCVAETHQVEQAWSELSELLSQLHHKMEYAANTIRCTNCGKRHKRVIMQRPCYAARFCAQCKIHHSAREGDIWAESWMMGLMWHYLACMEGAVYDITEWAACQADNLKHLKANSHAVQYRIVLGKQNQPHHAKDNYNEPDLEEFLNNLYAQSGGGGGESSSGGAEGNIRQRRKGKRKK